MVDVRGRKALHTLTMTDELTELNEGDDVHITINGGKTLPLTVGNVRDDEYMTVQYDGQNYANVKWAYESDDHTWTLIPLHADDRPVGVDSIEVA